MRGRMAWQGPFMHRDARPRDARHEWHWGIALYIRAVVAVLLDHAEDAHRRRMTCHAGRHMALDDANPVAIERHMLVGDRNDDLQRTFRYLADVVPRLCFFEFAEPVPA